MKHLPIFFVILLVAGTECLTCSDWTHITLQLHSPEVLPQASGYIAAQKLGYFSAQCLNVTIQTGQPSEVIDAVLNNDPNQITFGTQYTFSIVNSSRGDELVIIAQLFQYPSFRLVWPQSTKMQGGLQCSLDGKTIGTIPTFILPCEAFISSCNVVLKDNPDPVSPPNNWGVDILSATTYDQLASLYTIFNDQGGILSPNDFIVYNYTSHSILEDAVVVSRAWLSSHSAIATEFLAAAFQGWIYCRDHEDNCTSWLPSGSTPVAMYQMREVNRLIWPSPSGIGSVSDSVISNNTKIMQHLNSMYNYSSLHPPFEFTWAANARLQLDPNLDVHAYYYNQPSLSFCVDDNSITLCQATSTNSNSSKSSIGLTTIIVIVIPICVVLAIASAVGLFVIWRRKANIKLFSSDDPTGGAGYYIDFNDLTVEAKIGSGSFGDVYKGTWRDTPVAVKRLRRNVVDQLDELKREAVMMLQLRHPHIVLFMGCCPDPPNVCIVTEFMPKGSLFDVLHDERVDLPWERRLSMAKDTAKGLTFLHGSDPPTLHNDLKSPNLLVSHNWVCKVSDFGLTSLKGSRTQDELLGSIYWMAPEVLNNEPATEKSDVYSFGNIYY